MPMALTQYETYMKRILESQPIPGNPVLHQLTIGRTTGATAGLDSDVGRLGLSDQAAPNNFRPSLPNLITSKSAL